METQALATKKENLFEKIMDEWSKGCKHILAAAKLYVKALNENPANREVFYKKAKGKVQRSTFRALEAVGRDLRDYRLLSGFDCGPHAAKIKKLPRDLQEKVLDGCMFEFLTVDGSPQMVLLRDTEDWIAKQMFANGGIRNLPEQKAWLEAEKVRLKLAEVEHTVPYEIKKKGVLIPKANTFIKNEEWKQVALQLH